MKKGSLFPMLKLLLFNDKFFITRLILDTGFHSGLLCFEIFMNLRRVHSATMACIPEMVKFLILLLFHKCFIRLLVLLPYACIVN